MKDMKTEKPQRHDQSCYHVPQTVNPRFWGRSEVICKIKEALDPDDQAQDQRSFAIWGMGGVGKTQIALKYVASNRQQFNTIIWISAGSSIQISQSFRDVAGRLGFSGNDQETEDTMAAVMKVKDWLEQTSKRLHGIIEPANCILGKRWLLIFDNADDVSVFKHAWPSHSAGSILLTTRNPNVAFDLAKGNFQVEPLDDTEGSQLLLKLSGVKDASDSNQDSAQAISHTLGGLPLALDQIGGFIQQRRIALRDFLQLYNRNADKINSKKSGITDYEHTISTVWEMSLNNLGIQPRTLLELFAFMNPDKIDEIILKEAPQATITSKENLEFLSDEMDLLDAEEELLQGTLINKNSDAGFLSVHRLLQAAIMRKLSTEVRVGYFDAVVGFLCWGFPDTFSKDIGHQHQSWEICEKCLPHVDHVVTVQERYSIVSSDMEAFSQLLLRCCWYLYEREIYEIARLWITVALKNFGDKSTLAFASAVELRGLIEMDLNRQASALDSFTQVLELRTALLGPDDAFIAASLTTLGIVHTELGNLAEAHSYHEKAIDIRLRTNSDRIGNSYSNMSSLLLRMDKADEAEEMLKRCPSLKDFTDETFLNTGNPRFSG